MADNRRMSSDGSVNAPARPPVVTHALLQEARTGAVLARLPAGVIRAAGPDAAAFVHGQLANDVTGLKVGGVNQSLSLNHRGHALAEASVLRTGKDELLVVVDDGRAQLVFEGLDSHIIFDQVELEWRPQLALLTLQGAGAAGLLPLTPDEGKYTTLELAGAPVTLYPRRRSEQGGFDLLVEADDVPGVVQQLAAAGAVEVSGGVIDALRVLGAVPTAAGEAGGGVLPQEAGLEGSLSYRKGCYLGQEIMARIEARGNLRRSLARLVLSGAPEFQGDDRPITLEGRTVGRLGSTVQLEGMAGAPSTFMALAVLRNDLPADAQLQVGGRSGQVA